MFFKKKKKNLHNANIRGESGAFCANVQLNANV